MNKKKLLIIAALLIVAFVSLVAVLRTSSLALTKSEVITASEFGHRQSHRITGDFEMILRCYMDSYAAGKCIVYQYSAEIDGASQRRHMLIIFDSALGTEYQVAYEIDEEKRKIENRIIIRLN